MKRLNLRYKLIAISGVLGAIIVAAFLGHNAWQEFLVEQKQENKSRILNSVRAEFDRYFREGGERPNNLVIDGNEVALKYAINLELEAFTKKMISRYSSAHVAVVVMDNDTGNLLVSIGHSRANREFGPFLPFTATHPAASLFKIITAADLLENTPVTEDSRFKFHGRGTTLYRRQLEQTNSRWARYQSLEKAFAYSNNVIFGKAAMNQTNAKSILKTAFNFGFNRDIMDDVNLSRSIVEMPESQYNLAEIATGFNRDTLVSPVHAAAIAAAIANGGEFVTPRFLNSVIDTKNEETLWQARRSTREAMSAENAMALRHMMELTVSKGTARGSFRRFDRKVRSLVSVGGKTGSISGGMPDGKRDWFTAFAIPKDSSAGKGISISVMIVNDNKWYIKSSYLAKEIITYYFKKIMRIENAFLRDGSSQRKGEQGKKVNGT